MLCCTRSDPCHVNRHDTNKPKRKQWRRPVTSVSLFLLTLLILISNDVQINPGPMFSYGECGKPVQSNQAALCCDSCDVWSRRKCVGMSIKEYYRLGQCDEEWCCFCCLLSADPFFEDVLRGSLRTVMFGLWLTLMTLRKHPKHT